MRAWVTYNHISPDEIIASSIRKYNMDCQQRIIGNWASVENLYDDLVKFHSSVVPPVIEG